MDVVVPPTRRALDLRLELALRAGRAAGVAARRLRGGRGHAALGRVALGMDPGAARKLAEHHRIALVTGTNGKSTTTAMLTAAMRTRFPCDSNDDGANTPVGLVATLAEARSERVVCETDEPWLPWVVDHTHPELVVLLNLSRDQLHRNPELGRLASAWRVALAQVPLVVANADDPLVVWAALGAGRQVWFSGGRRWRRDSILCPACGARLQEDEHGWGCTCGLTRPTPDWTLTGDVAEHNGHRFVLDLGLPGHANLVDAMAALAAAAAGGVPPSSALTAIASLTEVDGRYGRTTHAGHEVQLLLAKNPAGWLESLSMVDPDSSVVLAFNSDGVDGRDPSWLYDVDLTPLRGRDLVVYGRRATDLLTRLELDGFTARRATDLNAALASCPGERVTVVANYTAFVEARAALDHAG